ncbi:IS3 family transposase [Desulfomicrobium norvegicum]|uniref:IS3 family transposase n=1 Tax=Desulfomicrobium norvegicum (strain DSM 1741 / NCIMB 8310) TaxID=52561 RepID=UPI001FC9B2CE|nr:IS3 family transposase [Desulfomicrobium norvegicum]
MRDQYPVNLLCKLARVSASGFYGWLSARKSRRATRNETLREAVRFYHRQSNGIYGYRKVHRDLVEDAGLSCSLETVRRVMQVEGLRSKIIRKHRYPSKSERPGSRPDNVLARTFQASAPDRKWVADITYLWTNEGWLYLAIVLDLFSRRVVGWSMSDRADAQLACQALRAAVQRRKPNAGLLHHSDQGCQYTSEAFRTALAQSGLECSMSRRGNCWDNAVAESFFSKLKKEWICDKRYRTYSEARLDVFIYLESFYNRQRRHAFLGYLSPEAFEKSFYQRQRNRAA